MCRFGHPETPECLLHDKAAPIGNDDKGAVLLRVCMGGEGLKCALTGIKPSHEIIVSN
ncbi:hypothetical protein GCM10025859_52210 [Alicyclobacillus fastidiosus]|nr:hypothetical protein GCM10025859_52210 [Alicyclobacillus fastidiosus]